MVEVTDEDRQAAERWGTGPVYNMQHLAQAFARHRIAAEQRGKIKGARLALEAAAKKPRDQADADDIRALSPAKIVGEG